MYGFEVFVRIEEHFEIIFILAYQIFESKSEILCILERKKMKQQRQTIHLVCSTQYSNYEAIMILRLYFHAPIAEKLRKTDRDV